MTELETSYLYPGTPCLSYMPISWDGFGGQCRHIWQSHGVPGYKYDVHMQWDSKDHLLPRNFNLVNQLNHV